MLVLMAALAARVAAANNCAPGYYQWFSSDGLEHCRLCPAGCACAGGTNMCLGCSGGSYSATNGASVCSTCPPGTTSDFVFNVGCAPDNYETPCANWQGPLGHVGCRPVPPPQNTSFTAWNDALVGVPEYQPGGPPYVPLIVPPYYDNDGQPMLQQSY